MQSFKIPFLFLWEFPQNLLGVIVFAIMKYQGKVVRVEQTGIKFLIETPKTGVSLGWIIFWTPSGNRFAHLTNDCLLHELGHSRQSVLLGPLYLVIIGIPSLCRVIYSRWYYRKNHKKWENYFNGFPENWADKLGGVSPAK